MLLTHVLRVNIVNAAIDMAVTMLKDSTDPLAARRAALKERLKQTEKELANLANTIAELGGSPTFITAMKDREAERSACWMNSPRSRPWPTGRRV